MLRKLFRTLVVLVAALAGLALVMYMANAAPSAPAVSAADAAKADKPYVVKLHAQWCPVCMITKEVWSQIEQAYAGRVHLVVLDFTNDANTEASRAEAARLGLQTFYDEYAGATGVVVVLDARTRQVTASIDGSRNFAEYRAAIDQAITAARR